jgi:hypothetical protein
MERDLIPNTVFADPTLRWVGWGLQGAVCPCRGSRQSPENFLKWYFVFLFCKIWYFIFPSACAIWYLRSVSAIILVFHLPFSFCNLVFAFSFCNYFGISSRRYFLVSAIWYFVFCCFCILVLCDCWLWLLKEIIHFSLWVWGWMGKTIRIGVM